MKNKTIKNIIIALVIVLISLAIYFLIPFIKLLYTEDGRALLDQKIQSYGILAPLIFIGIEILQIIAAFIPGAPIEILGGVIFGKFWGVVFAFVGVFAGTVIVFYLVRIFGKPLVYKIFPKEKIENNKLLKNQKKLSTIIFLLFLIPGTPKDFMTYIAALTDIPPFKFLLITALARVPAMICSVVLGDSVLEGNYKLALIILGIIVLFSVIGYFVKTKIINKD